MTIRYKINQIMWQTIIQNDNESKLSGSDYNLSDVVSVQEFQQLSKQISIGAAQRQNLIGSFYCSEGWKQSQNKFYRKQQKQISPYQQEYRKWKGQQQKLSDFGTTYSSALALVSKSKQDQQMKRLMKEHKVASAIYKYDEKNAFIDNTKELHSKDLNQAMSRDYREDKKQDNYSSRRTDQISKSHLDPKLKEKSQVLIKQQNQLEVIKKRQHLIELAVQKQLLGRIKNINQKEKQSQQRLKKQSQMKKTCFVNLIARPPAKGWKNQMTNSSSLKQNQLGFKIPQIETNTQMFRQDMPVNKIEEKTPRYKLNIQQIIKIPHKMFLIFYSDYYHQLTSLASPQQMKKIDNYRDQALQKQQALDKLKHKIAAYGPEMISKLPPSSRQKLFRLLYEKDLEQQKYNTN